jgi:hypothetical protein
MCADRHIARRVPGVNARIGQKVGSNLADFLIFPRLAWPELPEGRGHRFES